MHKSAMQYGQDFFSNYCSGDFTGKTIVDVGAQDVNGSLRVFCPAGANYIGVDFIEGNGVDVVLEDPYKLPFDNESADIVVCSSVFEHSEFFWLLYLECIRILKPTGLLYINVPSNGKVHRYPVDSWRFYPDAAIALVNWAKYNNYNSQLLESFIGEKVGPIEGEGLWNDFVAVILKDKSYEHMYPLRIKKELNELSYGFISEGDINNPDYSLILKLKDRLFLIRNILADRETEISNIYNSISWKITLPLRIIRSLIAKLLKISFHGLIKSIIGKRLVNKISRNRPSPYQKWIDECENFSVNELSSQRILAEDLPHKPLISILMPTYNSNPNWLKEAIESVINQTYTNWELCIADDFSNDQEIINLLNLYSQLDPRIKVYFRQSNGHISEATNTALSLASGDWFALLDHDDKLRRDALFQFAKVINEHPDIKFIYSDEDKIDYLGKRCDPLFKPDWSPHLACSQAYIGHFLCFKNSNNSLSFDQDLNGSQDYDFTLQRTSDLLPTEIFHVRKVLYHWRMHQDSTSINSNAKDYAHKAGLKSVEKYIRKKYKCRDILVEDGDYKFTYKLKFCFGKEPLVSIIIPTKDKIEFLSECLESIFRKTIYKNYEIIIINNNSNLVESKEYFKWIIGNPRVKVVDADFDFNWSKVNNLGVANASGEVFVFLNNDTKIINGEWLSSLVGYAQLPDVGVVGALLLYDDKTIQHSGVVVGMHGWADHLYKNLLPRHQANLFVSPVITRNVLAVTGACMAIARDKFDLIGKFDEDFIICGSDVEICIRAYKAGYFNVMCAESKLYHFESKTRTPHVPEIDFDQSILKYAPFRVDEIDPFFNPNLSLFSNTPKLQFGIK